MANSGIKLAVRLTRFGGSPNPSGERIPCSEATGLTEPNEACRRSRWEKSEHFPTPGTSVRLREEPGERPNEKIVRFEHAGHLIYREHCEQFVAVVTAFIKEY
jgi:hypothetical protein